jgi:hypothetical protein
MLANTVYPVALDSMNSARLKSKDNIFLVAGQTIEISESKSDVPRERYRVRTLSYTYGFTRKSGDSEEELLAFHWERERAVPPPYPLGHRTSAQDCLPIRPSFGQATSITPTYQRSACHLKRSFALPLRNSV